MVQMRGRSRGVVVQLVQLTGPYTSSQRTVGESQETTAKNRRAVGASHRTTALSQRAVGASQRTTDIE